jgi:hypothetical protein
MSQRQAEISGQNRLVERAQKRRCAANKTRHKATAPHLIRARSLKAPGAISEHGLQFSKPRSPVHRRFHTVALPRRAGERESLRLA